MSPVTFPQPSDQRIGHQQEAAKQQPEKNTRAIYQKDKTMRLSAKDCTVQVSDGARLRVRYLGYEDTDGGNRGDGGGHDTDGHRTRPLVIALHGAPGLSDHREPETSFGFLTRRFRLLVYDARGSGESDTKGPFTHERWVADLEELRIWAGAPERYVLAGGSYGGFVALEYAIAFPARLSALILRDTWAHGLQGAMGCLKMVLTSPRIAPDPDRQVRVWSGEVTDNEDFEASFAEIEPIYKPPGNGDGGGKSSIVASSPSRTLHYETHNFAFSYNQPRFDVRLRLGDITASTLVTVGRHDPIAPVAFSEEILGGIPDARLQIFEHSGHSPPNDEPELFRQRVWQFLEDVGII